MEYVKLGDICEVLNGYAFKSENYTDNGIRVIRITNVQKGFVEDNDPQFYPIETQSQIEKYILRGGDLLISLTGNVGRVALLEEKFLPAALNQRVACLRLKNEKVLKSFLYHLLNSDYFENECIMSAKGVAQKNMSTEWLKEFKIPLFPVDVQHEISNTLDKVTDLIKIRKEQLKKLDELVKARFVELFGGCSNYELLQDSKIYISDGNYSSKYPTADEFVAEGVPFIRASNMEMNTIVDDNMYFITKEKHAILLKGHVKSGDVLITTRGATIGKIACVPPKHEDSNINAQIVLLRCPSNEYNPLYLSWYLKLDNTQAEIQKLISGSAQPQLPIKRLVQLNILKPDIEVQNKFAAFAEQTDKSKLEIQKGLEKLELLKKALMQKYFG